MPQFASEFTPELTANMLSGELNAIDKQEQEEEGQARREGAAGGLIGMASLGSRIGAAKSDADTRKSNTINAFNFDVAGKRREERLIGEKETYESGEAQRQREFQKQLAEMGYQFQSGERNAENRSEKISAYQGMATGAGIQLGTKLLTSYFA